MKYYTELITDGTLPCDASNGPITITMLSCAQKPGTELRIEKLDATANAITVVLGTNPATSVQDTFADGTTSRTVLGQGIVFIVERSSIDNRVKILSSQLGFPPNATFIAASQLHTTGVSFDFNITVTAPSSSAPNYSLLSALVLTASFNGTTTTLETITSPFTTGLHFVGGAFALPAAGTMQIWTLQCISETADGIEGQNPPTIILQVNSNGTSTVIGAPPNATNGTCTSVVTTTGHYGFDVAFQMANGDPNFDFTKKVSVLATPAGGAAVIIGTFTTFASGLNYVTAGVGANQFVDPSAGNTLAWVIQVVVYDANGNAVPNPLTFNITVNQYGLPVNPSTTTGGSPSVPAPAMAAMSAGASVFFQGNTPSFQTYGSVTLPSDISNISEVQIRWGLWSGSGVLPEGVTDVDWTQAAIVSAGSSGVLNFGASYGNNSANPNFFPSDSNVAILLCVWNADGVMNTPVLIQNVVIPTCAIASVGTPSSTTITLNTGAQQQIALTYLPVWHDGAQYVDAPGATSLHMVSTEFLSCDNGTTFFFIGTNVQSSLSSTCQAGGIYIPWNASWTECILAVVPGWLPNNLTFSTPLPSESNPTGPFTAAQVAAWGGVNSSAFTIACPGAPLATDCTNIAVTNFSTGYPYEWWPNSSGVSNNWTPGPITMTVPALGTDPNAWAVQLTIRQGTDANGTGGVESPGPCIGLGSFAGGGTITLQFDSKGWEYPPSGNTALYYVLCVYVVSNYGTAQWGSAGAKYTLQPGWPSGASKFVIQLPSTPLAAAKGTYNASVVLGGGLTKTSTGLALSVSSGLSTASGTLVALLSGPLTFDGSGNITLTQAEAASLMGANFTIVSGNVFYTGTVGASQIVAALADFTSSVTVGVTGGPQIVLNGTTGIITITAVGKTATLSSSGFYASYMYADNFYIGNPGIDFYQLTDTYGNIITGVQSESGQVGGILASYDGGGNTYHVGVAGSKTCTSLDGTSLTFWGGLLTGFSSGTPSVVTKIIAGTNVTINPTSGIGNVTVNATVPVTNVTGGTGINVSPSSGTYSVSVDLLAGGGIEILGNEIINDGLQSLNSVTGNASIVAGANITVTVSGAVGSITVATAGASGTITYAKPGSGSGTITVSDGAITAFT